LEICRQEDFRAYFVDVFFGFSSRIAGLCGEEKRRK